MAKGNNKAATPVQAPATPAPATPATPATPAPRYHVQAAAMPKGKRGQRRFAYPAPGQAIAAANVPATPKGQTVAAYLAQAAASGAPATYGGLHAVSGTAARNAWRLGWVVGQ